MRIVRGNEIELTIEIESKYQELIRKIFSHLPLQYNLEEDDETMAWLETKFYPPLPFLLSIAGDLNGKTLLDLGCGSVSQLDNYGLFKDRDFEPWLARGLHYIGVKVIGVDKGCLDYELFEHYRCNLLNPTSLSSIRTNSIDITSAFQLFGSPSLVSRDKHAADKVRDALLPQLERILKSEGVFLYMDYDTEFRV